MSYPNAARRVARGMTLIELLVAVSLASVVLVGAWPWCWTIVRTSHQSAERAEAESSLAFAGRLFTSEVRRSAVLGDATGRGCSASAVVLQVVNAITGKTEVVTYRYDPAGGCFGARRRVPMSPRI